MPDTDNQSTNTPAQFGIFRRAGHGLGESGHMRRDALSDGMATNLSRLVETQGPHAAETRYLFGGNGMSLCSAWFKSGYPLPIHSHDADCLYYIVAGSLRLGTETIEAGDGFFVPADVPYTYTAGPDGVELLEFRTAEQFDIRFTSSSESYWSKIFRTIGEQRDKWPSEPRPVRQVEEQEAGATASPALV